MNVARALHCAHDSGVVHRDLKPGNIMMDIGGEPHIVDFGLAKRDAGEITMTVEGQILGTPAYMSPEQARGDAHHVDRKADIYSLGVILFELLTGELPFRGDKQMLLAQIVNDVPPSPRKMNGKVPRDLETICLKCLEKEPRRRFETARLFADDCERFLNGEPVLARPISRLARGLRWCRRNPMVAGLSMAVVALFVGISVVTLFDLATETELRTLRGHLNRVTAVCWHPHGHRIATGSIDGAVKIWSTPNRPRFLPGAAAIFWNPSGTKYASRIGTSVVICDVVASHVERWLDGHATFVFAVSWSPDGASVASASYDGDVRVWDAATGDVICTAKGQAAKLSRTSRLPTVLAWSRDSRRLAFPFSDRVIRIVDAKTAERVHDLTGDAKLLLSLAWSSDGSYIASGGEDEGIRLWNARTGQLERTLGNPAENSVINAICWNRDGSRLASANGDTTVAVWDAATGQRLLQLFGHTTYVHTVSWSSDGRRIASADESGSIRIWDAVTGQETVTLSYPGGAPMVAWNPDNQSLACVGYGGDASVRIWDTAVDRSASLAW